MKKQINKGIDRTFWKFILVGIVNTLFGTGVMFLFYNVIGLNYWISSASNYFFGSILSYVLNKRFTFQSKGKSGWTLIRFALHISVCYLIAYGAAKPLVRFALKGFGTSAQDNFAMLVGMCLFVCLNYLGQRFFVFREKRE